MPRPPIEPRKGDEQQHAFGERPTIMPAHDARDVREVLGGLFGELVAERLAAEARHKVLLASLEEHRHAYEVSVATMFEKHSCKIVESGACENKLCTISSDSKRKYTDIAQDLSRSVDSYREDPSGSLHLARASRFQFGTKMSSKSKIDLEEGFITSCVNMARNIVEHIWSEGVVASLIMGNALVMCCELQYDGLQIGFLLDFSETREAASSRWPAASDVFTFMEWFFGVLFLLEALLKLLVFHMAYFRVFWNWLDLFCVAAFLVDKVVRALRLFRLARLVRLIRTLENLDVLYIMTTAIKGMTMILLWSVLLLSVILMACALFLSTFVQSTYFDGKSAESLTEDEVTKHQTLYRYFGTFTRCMLSMFEITLANWTPVARLIQEEVSEWFSIVCILHKLAIGFAVIGVINGVILQETFKVALTDDMVMVRQKKRAKTGMRKKMESFFEALDIDRDGDIAFKEFMIIASQPEVRLWLESLDLEVDDLLTLFMLVDGDGDGRLTLDEIMRHIPRLRGAARGIDMMALRKGIPAYVLEEVESLTPTEKNKFKWTDGRKTMDANDAAASELSEMQFEIAQSQR